ncbi:MAG: c-type cytochrome biogenesis protein CcsB [Deltaproteobacteria bacterium]|nr:MAG: c-type cytochrome biogenesis protein CcsB [Deltaproteobacteria bacterium]
MEKILHLKTVALIFELRAFLLVSALYLTAFVLYAYHVLTGHDDSGRWGTGIVAVGNVLHTLLIAFRWIEAGRPPYQTLFESLSWFAWCSTATFLFIMAKKPRVHATGLPVVALSVFALFFGLFTRNPAAPPLAPALKSPWFLWHVIIAFLAYAVFVVSCSVELVSLFLRKNPERKGLSLEEFEEFHRYAYRLVALGFPLLTFGIVSGAAWANDAWGRFWSWDPKETWSLITWTVFAAYLHAYSLPAWREKFAPYLNLLGFVCMIITFIGINWLAKLLGIPSLHVYAV